MALTSSCYEEESVDEGEGLSDWSASTHGSNTTPSYDEVFSSSEVHRMDIVIDPDYWDIMIDNLEDILGTSSSFAKPPGGDVGGVTDSDISETPSYVPCSIFWNDIEWYYVGVRFKGNSSLSTAYNSKTYKLPLRLKFDNFASEYPQITGQTFYGFSELSLSSNFLDMSMMREKTAADLFREFDVPAPHTSFCRIYVDHGDGPVYFGLYTIVEIISDTMLAEQFGSETGNCYKPEGTGASFDEGTFSEDDFEKKTNVTNGDWSDIENLFDILHDDSRTNDPAQWRDDLESIFDVNEFLRWLAVNTTIQNWDTYGIMTHNYYLYHDPSDNLIKWIPWDNNEAFQDGKQGGALSINLSEVDSS
jgi:spore coat protein CotH